MKYFFNHLRFMWVVSWGLFCLPMVGQQVALSPQMDSLAGFVRNIVDFNRRFLQEKVWLHFDNHGYFMGETIWFKAYVVNPMSNRPQILSRVLYVELLTPEGRVVQTQKCKIEHGQASGQISLANLLHAGFYEVRAYTALMLNWEEAPLFSRVFPVFNAPQMEAKGMYDNPRMVSTPVGERRPEMREKPLLKNKHVNIALFPEGGHLVNGLSTRVSLKVTDKQGNPVEASGKVCNSRGEVVATWQTVHDGMGRFSFTPRSGETYYAELADGKDGYRVALPEALSAGYVMSVDNMSDSTLTLTVQRTHSNSFDEGNEKSPLGITVMCRGQVLRFHEVEWKGDEYELILPKALLSEGICQFTLFDTEGRIHADRLAFIPPRRGIKISMVGKKETYRPMELVELDFNVSDDSGHPISTVFSLSVRDADTDTPESGNYSGNMAANLLLGSDLKGYIHDVDYYLEADDEAHRLAVDLLVTTQGWRRYDWNQMTRPDEFKVKYAAEEGIMVMGNLTSTIRNRPREGAFIQVSILGSEGEHLKGTSVVGEDGRFVFQAPDFYGRRTMRLATKKSKDKKDFKEMRVNLHKVKRPRGRHISDGEKELRLSDVSQLSPIWVDTLAATDLEADNPHRYENLLPTVEIEAAKEWEVDNVRRWSNLIYDMADERLAMDETGENYLLEFYRWLERVNPFFRFTTEMDDTGNIYLDATYKGRKVIFIPKRVGSSEWISNEKINTDVSRYTIQDVEAITISDKYDAIHKLSKEGYTTHYTGKEVVVILFLRKDYLMRDDASGQRKTLLQGFTPSVSFYVPDYSMTLLPDEKDFRRTLYWDPYVITDQQGHASVSFYNSPSAQRIKVDAQTITFSGLMGGLEE